MVAAGLFGSLPRDGVVPVVVIRQVTQIHYLPREMYDTFEAEMNYGGSGVPAYNLLCMWMEVGAEVRMPERLFWAIGDECLS